MSILKKILIALAILVLLLAAAFWFLTRGDTAELSVADVAGTEPTLDEPNAEMFPTVRLRLNIEGLGAVAACVLNGEAHLGIAGPIVDEHAELERQVIGQIELIPVAAPDHPLALNDVKPGESREHLQLVLADRSTLTEGREFGVLSPQSWRLGDLSAKHDLIKQGVGWGNMPTHLITNDLKAGRLIELDLPEKPGAGYALSASWRRDSKPGPAMSWLIDTMRQHLGEFTPS